MVALRGNVDTRLGKLSSAEGAQLHAIVLARAGLQRLGREAEIGGVLEALRFVPAPGQGTLALQGRGAGASHGGGRAGGSPTRALLPALRAERALARELGASCHTPFGALGEPVGDSGEAAPVRMGGPARRLGLGARSTARLEHAARGARRRWRGGCGRPAPRSSCAARRRRRALAASETPPRARLPGGRRPGRPRPADRARARADRERRCDPLRPADPAGGARRRSRRGAKLLLRGQGRRRAVRAPGAHRGGDARACTRGKGASCA